MTPILVTGGTGLLPLMADFVAKVENRPAPEISQKLIFRRLRHCNTSVEPMRSSVVVFVRNDVAPHIAAHETHERPWKILAGTPKRLLQQYRHKSDMRTQSPHVRC